MSVSPVECGIPILLKVPGGLAVASEARRCHWLLPNPASCLRKSWFWGDWAEPHPVLQRQALVSSLSYSGQLELEDRWGQEVTAETFHCLSLDLDQQRRAGQCFHCVCKDQGG